jgi:hypothetical protein
VDPQRYPTVVESIRVILMEGGPQALTIGAGATVIGYLVYGGVSFGLTGTASHPIHGATIW